MYINGWMDEVQQLGLKDTFEILVILLLDYNKMMITLKVLDSWNYLITICQYIKSLN